MTTVEKIAKATELLNDEGYIVNHKMMVFSLFQNNEIEQDKIKSIMRINSKCCYTYSPDKIHIEFNLTIRKIDNTVCSVAENIELADYIKHLCDVVSYLNYLDISLNRNLSELNLE